MRLSRRSRVLALVSTAALSVGIGGSTAQAQQEGLVNLSVTNNTIQVPIGVAANICDVDANVLVQDLREGNANCDAVSQSTAISRNGGGGGGGGGQQGLVNIDISNNTVQVPVAVAANVCGVSVNVLASMIDEGNVRCTATSWSRARS